MQAGAVSIYSRNSENNTSKYPDLVSTLPSLLTEGTKSVVLDCEAVAFDRTTNKILPFQVLLQSFVEALSTSEAPSSHIILFYRLIHL